jgi:hypothetical protein
MATVSGSLSSACSVFGGSSLYGLRRGATPTLVPNYNVYTQVSTTNPSLSSLVGLVYPIATSGNVNDYSTFNPSVLTWSGGAITPSNSGIGLTWLLYGWETDCSLWLTKDSSQTGFTSSTLNTWITISGAFVSQPGGVGQIRTASGTWQIKENQSGDIICSGNWNLECDRE